MNIIQDFLVVNQYSRPGTKMQPVRFVVVHYVGNPGSSAKNNRNYFNNLATTKATYVSSHYVVGLDGEIIQCIPENEIAYCQGSPYNSYSISIEVCHPDSTGKFSTVTEGALVELVADILKRNNLTVDKVLRHYDCTGKACPLYYVNNPSAWVAFKEAVGKKLTGKVETPVPSGKLYRVQLGAFSVKSNADKLCAELKGKGYDAFVRED